MIMNAANMTMHGGCVLAVQASIGANTYVISGPSQNKSKQHPLACA